MKVRVVSLTLDWDGDEEPPGPGDELVTHGGSLYLVLEVRQVHSFKHPSRWRIKAQKDPEPGESGKRRRLTFHWNPRERNRP